MKDLQDMTVEEMIIENFVVPVPEERYEELGLKNINDADTLPLVIHNFPWNEGFTGLVFSISDIKLNESEEEDSTELFFRYDVHSNPKGLPIALGDNDESIKTEENNMLDLFVGRVIESMLDRMVKNMRDEEETEQTETTGE